MRVAGFCTFAAKKLWRNVLSLLHLNRSIAFCRHFIKEMLIPYFCHLQSVYTLKEANFKRRSWCMLSSERYCINCGAANALEAELCFACGLSLKITAPLSLETPGNGHRLLLERYRILAQVGKGGFSAVDKAEDMRFNAHCQSIEPLTLNGP